MSSDYLRRLRQLSKFLNFIRQSFRVCQTFFFAHLSQTNFLPLSWHLSDIVLTILPFFCRCHSTIALPLLSRQCKNKPVLFECLHPARWSSYPASFNKQDDDTTPRQMRTVNTILIVEFFEWVCFIYFIKLGSISAFPIDPKRRSNQYFLFYNIDSQI